MDASEIRSDTGVCNSAYMSTDFWPRLVEAFADSGLETSQSAIARHLDIGQSAVAKWAHGSGYPTLRKCIHIARITGVSVEWLLTGRGNKNQKGGDMDDLTQRLLEQWAELPEAAQREILEFVKFRVATEPEAVRGSTGPRRPRKQ
jgi:transcriptional regulator with XRE-family HTH domain